MQLLPIFIVFHPLTKRVHASIFTKRGIVRKQSNTHEGAQVMRHYEKPNTAQPLAYRPMFSPLSAWRTFHPENLPPRSYRQWLDMHRSSMIYKRNLTHGWKLARGNLRRVNDGRSKGSGRFLKSLAVH
jgi:hypothetical protein